MKHFIIIQCLTEHVDIVLSYGACSLIDTKHYKHHSQILLFTFTEHKPYLRAANVPYAIIKDGLVDEAYFLNPEGLLISTRVTQSLMQAKNINWKVQKERMKVLNLLKITG